MWNHRSNVVPPFQIFYPYPPGDRWREPDGWGEILRPSGRDFAVGCLDPNSGTREWPILPSLDPDIRHPLTFNTNSYPNRNLYPNSIPQSNPNPRPKPPTFIPFEAFLKMTFENVPQNILQLGRRYYRPKHTRPTNNIPVQQERVLELGRDIATAVKLEHHIPNWNPIPYSLSHKITLLTDNLCPPLADVPLRLHYNLLGRDFADGIAEVTRTHLTTNSNNIKDRLTKYDPTLLQQAVPIARKLIKDRMGTLNEHINNLLTKVEGWVGSSYGTSTSTIIEPMEAATETETQNIPPLLQQIINNSNPNSSPTPAINPIPPSVPSPTISHPIKLTNRFQALEQVSEGGQTPKRPRTSSPTSSVSPVRKTQRHTESEAAYEDQPPNPTSIHSKPNPNPTITPKSTPKHTPKPNPNPTPTATTLTPFDPNVEPDDLQVIVIESPNSPNALKTPTLTHFSVFIPPAPTANCDVFSTPSGILELGERTPTPGVCGLKPKTPGPILLPTPGLFELRGDKVTPFLIHNSTHTLLVGDSNLRHFNQVPSLWQIVCIPGLNLQQLTFLLHSIYKPPSLKHIIISAGINDRDNLQPMIQDCLKAARGPNIKVHFQTIISSPKLQLKQQQNLNKINRMARESPGAYLIPCTVPDPVFSDHAEIHYDKRTSARIYDGILAHINSLNF
jgi:hypothetical protein